MADTNDIRAPVTAPAASALGSIASLDRQLVAARRRTLERQRQRQRQYAGFRRQARHSAYIFFLLLFAAAGLADLLSIVKDVVEAVPVIGWMIGIAASIFTAVCVGVPIYFAQRRVKRINTETSRIAQEARQLQNELGQQFRRLRPALQDSGRTDLIRATDPATLGRGVAFVAYNARIIMNIAIVQILEAIPIVDLGPWQVVKVLQVFIHQQCEFRQTRVLLLAYQQLSSRLEILERFEREYMEALLSAAVLQAVATEDEARRQEQRRLARPQSRLSNPVADIVPAA